MQLRNTIIVVVLVVLVGGYALYVSHQPKPETTPKVYKVKAADIEKIDLRYPDREIVLERGGGGSWKITKPIQADADQNTVEAIASAIADCEITRTVEEKPADLANFGLKVPSTTVIVTTKGNKVLPVLKVGKNAPVGDSVYIMAADKPGVLLTASSLSSSVNKTVDAVRSHVLIGFERDKVQKFAIQHGDGTPTIEVDQEGGKWWIVKPSRYLADQAAVTQLLDAMANAKVSDFVTDKPAGLGQYGLTNPTVTLTLYTGKNNARESVSFGGRATDANMTYVRRGEGDAPICTVYNYLQKVADKSVLDLRDKTVVTFDQSKVDRAVLSGATGNVTIARASGGKWTASAEGKSKPAEVPVVESLLDQLHDLKGTSILEDPMSDPRPFGLDHPFVTAVLYDKDGKELGGMKLAQKVEPAGLGRNGQPATDYKGYAVSDKNAVYAVAAEKVYNLENTVDRLHSNVIPTPTPAPTPTATPAVPHVGPSLKASPSPAAS